MTDVIEDVQVFLQWTIDYLTAVLNSLRVTIRRNSHRPFNRKTLVRWLATFFPRPKDPKIYLQHRLRASTGSENLKRWDSLDSLQSALSTASVHRWLEEDLGHNLIHFRRASLDDGDVSDGSQMSEQRMLSPGLLTSTPNRNFSSCSSIASENASGRISEMEEELSALRKQIAMLVMVQESVSLNKTVTGCGEEESKSEVSQAAVLPLPLSPSTSHLDDSGCESECLRPPSPEPGDPATLPPAPPPPPPPPMLPPLAEVKMSGPSFSDMLKERKSQLASQRSEQPQKDIVPNMSHVLRDLANVKLKRVERSPGGTPMRCARLKTEPSDPASIIAQALKKKFAAHFGKSPDSDKENDSSSFFSESPNPLYQKVPKKAQRRLSLFSEDDSWTPVASPLRTINA